MTYLISDIHGCYAEYRELLSKINFTDDDELYVLGDAMDRGTEPIKVMLDQEGGGIDIKMFDPQVGSSVIGD